MENDLYLKRARVLDSIHSLCNISDDMINDLEDLPEFSFNNIKSIRRRFRSLTKEIYSTVLKEESK